MISLVRTVSKKINTNGAVRNKSDIEFKYFDSLKRSIDAPTRRYIGNGYVIKKININLTNEYLATYNILRFISFTYL